eukprot:5530392-Pleurochrysis_carterae.AAC.1
MGNYKEIVPNYTDSQMRSRIELCFNIPESVSRQEVDELGRHDKRVADILLTENTSRLQRLKEQ